MDGWIVSKCLSLLFMLMLLMFDVSSDVVVVASNFNPPPICYYDNKSHCAEESCGITFSKKADINCEIVSMKTFTESQIKTDTNISMSYNFIYPSNNFYCYPYLNFKWQMLPDILKNSKYFYLKISFDLLGQPQVVHKLMNISVNKSLDIPVTFSFKCLQLSYPGVVYEIFISAFNQNREQLASSNIQIIGPCELKLKNNLGSFHAASNGKDAWIPKYRVVPSNGSFTIFFTMPDSSIGIWALDVSLKYRGLTKEHQIRCICPFKNSIIFDNLSAGNYTLKFSTHTEISKIGKPILEHQLVLFYGVARTTEIVPQGINGQFTAVTPSNDNSQMRTSHLLTSEEDNSKFRMWIAIGVSVTILWTVTLSFFCYRAKSSSREINVCLRVLKDKNRMEVVSKEVKLMKFDSGIDSKCSHFESSCVSQNAKNSVGFVNNSIECCTCKDNCPECASFSFDFQMKFHPPSDDVGSINSFEFKEKIKSFNLESDNF